MPYRRTRMWLACAVACLFSAATARANDDKFDTDYAVVYSEPESGRLKADLYIPKASGTYPGVLVVHGGAWRSGSRAQLTSVAQLLARRGYAAVAISYRLAPTHKFPAQLEDCQSAVRWMRENAARLKIDPTRIGGFGYSAGAQLVSLLAVLGDRPVTSDSGGDKQNEDARLQAVVAGGAPIEFRTIPENRDWLSFWLGGTRGEVPDQYRRASPLAFVSPDDSPVFFYHGEADSMVPLESPQLMRDALADAGVESDLYVVPNVGHFLAATDREALDKAVDFLDAHLKQRTGHE